MATAAIFLAAKVEEQPRKLEYVAKVSHSCQNRDAPMLDTQSEVGRGCECVGMGVCTCVCMRCGCECANLIRMLLRVLLPQHVTSDFHTHTHTHTHTRAQAYTKLIEDITYHELILLETLGGQ